MTTEELLASDKNLVHYHIDVPKIELIDCKWVRISGVWYFKTFDELVFTEYTNQGFSIEDESRTWKYRELTSDEFIQVMTMQLLQ